MDQVKAALRRGDVLAAYDHALTALAARPDDVELKYLSVLTLARSGALSFAETRYRELGLAGVAADGQLGIDIGALAGRMAKDRALAASDGDQRRAHLQRAIEAYAIVSDRTADPYPLVNVAALRLWAGDHDGARRAAEKVLARLAEVPKADRDYWHFATSAEARLLSGDVAAAGDDIRAAAARSGTGCDRDWQALAVTASQLRRSCRAHAVDEAILDPLHVPPVVVYIGDGPKGDGSTVDGASFDPACEAGVRAAIRTALAEDKAWIFFGGLGAGFEIVLAEEVLARGGELNVVLPFAADTFVPRVIAPHGEEWVARFQVCLGRAASVRHATDHGYDGRTAPIRYAGRLAMGYAILRARPLDTSALMIIGSVDAERAGEMTVWSQTDRRTIVIPCGEGYVGRQNDGRQCDGRLGPEPDSSADCFDAATLFGDFTGFGKLPEHLVAEYADRLLGGIADIFDRYGTDVIARNSWGDAIVAQFHDVRRAARCAIDLQAFLKKPVTALAPDVEMRMRIGLHYGPVQRVFDKVQGRTSYLGAHVVRAARIEPVAIPGMIYVSEPFAAALAVDKQNNLVCDYLGILDSAKGFGKMPLYALREAR